jgi:hypothetical protein
MDHNQVGARIENVTVITTPARALLLREIARAAQPKASRERRSRSW